MQFVGAEGCGQESRLLQQLRRAAIRFSRRFELAGEQPIEVVNRSAKPAQMIVEREHLRDERRADMKRRRRAGLLRFASAGREHRFALESRQQTQGLGQSRDERLVERRARADVRPMQVIGQACIERSPELFGGRGGRHNHERVGGRRGIERPREIDERRSIAGQVGRAQQPDSTRGNHLPRGGSITLS